MRPKEGRGTADGRLLLTGQRVPIQGWMGADAAVRSEEVDADSALRRGRARRQPESCTWPSLDSVGCEGWAPEAAPNTQKPGKACCIRPNKNKSLLEGSGLWGQG